MIQRIQHRCCERDATAVFLLAAISAGAVLRLWRLGNISVWGDEYAGCLAGISAANLREYWNFLQIYGTSQPPLHPVLQYLWVCVTGSTDIFLLRLPNVLISLASIPVVYGVAARLAGRAAGRVAALCLALSSMHIWHAQSIRGYGLLTLLAGCSLYAAVHLLEGGPRRWWWVLFVVNFAAVWLQWMYFILIAVQFLALFWAAPKVRRDTLFWALAHAAWMLPLGLYIVRKPPLNVTFEAPLSWGDFYAGLLKEEIPAYDPSSQPAPFDIPQYLHEWLGRLADILIIFAILALLVSTIWRRRCAEKDHQDIAADRPHGAYFLLAAIIVFPVAILGFLQYISQVPFLSSRYVIYNSLARYSLFGAAITKCPSKALRWSGMTTIIAAFAYQLVLFLPVNRTTDYLSALDIIRREHHVGEFVMVDSLMAAHNFQFHMRDEAIPVFFASNPLVVRDIALWVLNPCGNDHPHVSRPAAVWHLFNLDWYTYDPVQWEQTMQEIGLQYDKWFLPGMERLMLYRITHASDAKGSVPESSPSIPEEVPDFLREPFETCPDNDAGCYAFRDVIHRLVDGRFSLLNNPLDAACLMLLQSRNDTLAERVAQLIREENPSPESNFVYHFIQFTKHEGCYETAALISQTTNQGPFLAFLRPFTRALSQQDYPGAFREADRLRRIGHPWGLCLREIIRRFTTPDAPTLPFGFAPLNAEDFALIAANFNDPNHPCSTGNMAKDYLLAEMLGLMERPSHAAAMLESWVASLPEEHFLKRRWKAYENQ